MFGSIIKFFTIILGSLFLYKKILHLKNISAVKILLSVIFSISLAYSMYLAQNIIPTFRIVIMIGAIGVFICVLTKTKIDLAITASVISLGMSYAFYYVSGIISAFLLSIILSAENMALLVIMTFIMDALIINIPFMFRRTKKGFLFLQRKESGGIGLIISGIIVTFVTLMGIRDMNDLIFGALFIGSTICIAGILLWWRSNLTKLYIEKLKEQNLTDLEKIIDEKNLQIQKLNESNDFLAGMIHRDNKLIPAMYNAVRRHMAEDSTSDECQLLLNQLEEIMRERSGSILQNQREHKTLPLTKVDLLDNILSYLYIKATEKNIEFDLRITGDIRYMAENIIPALKAETLLADLIENAIIASSTCQYKRILVTIGVSDNAYELSIQDSGINFEVRTLLDLGLHKATTHKESGGSGIGFMSVFEIIQETDASLIITENPPRPYSFSKTVTIRFDGRNEYVIKSFRGEEIREQCTRTDMIILPLLND